MIPEASCLPGSQKETFDPSCDAEGNWWDCYGYEHGHDTQSLVTQCQLRNSRCSNEKRDDECAEYHGNSPNEQVDIEIPSLCGVGGKGAANQGPMTIKVPKMAPIRRLITGYRLSGTVRIIAKKYRPKSCQTRIRQRAHSTSLRGCWMPLPLPLLVHDESDQFGSSSAKDQA